MRAGRCVNNSLKAAPMSDSVFGRLKTDNKKLMFHDEVLETGSRKSSADGGSQRKSFRLSLTPFRAAMQGRGSKQAKMNMRDLVGEVCCPALITTLCQPSTCVRVSVGALG